MAFMVHNRHKKNELLLLFLFSIITCSAKQKDEMIIINAHYERWTSGIKGGGSGVEYYIKIKILTTNKVSFDSLWVNNQSYKTSIASNNNVVGNAPITIKKNDTILVRASGMSPGNKSKPPIHLKGDGLLRYYVNGKANFIMIKTIKFLDAPNRP